MNIVTLSSKRQITLPNHLLLSIGVKPQSKMLIRIEKDTLVIKPLGMSVVKEVAGSLSKYVPAVKRGVPFAKIMKETQKKAAEELVKHV